LDTNKLQQANLSTNDVASMGLILPDIFSP